MTSDARPRDITAVAGANSIRLELVRTREEIASTLAQLRAAFTLRRLAGNAASVVVVLALATVVVTRVIRSVNESEET